MTRAHAPSRRAFTLVELIAASVIMALIAGGTVLSLSRSVKSRDTARDRYEAFSRASAAVEAVARDLQNTVRDADPRYAKVAVAPGTPVGDSRRDQLLLHVESLRPVRPQPPHPEAPTAEVQYRLDGSASPDQPAVLWRRIDPLPDAYPDAGGVASPLVPGILSLAFEASDGYEWFDQWDSDTDGYPHLVRVTVVATSDNGARTAVLRRTIAIDRPPLPGSFGAATPAETTDPASQPTSPDNSGTGNTGGANTGAGGRGAGGTGGGGTTITRPGQGGGGGGGGGQRPGGGGGRPPGGGAPGAPGGGGGGQPPPPPGGAP